jgi:hypothetical protein
MVLTVLAAALAGLQSGATIKLPPGPHPLIAIAAQRFDPPVTIDASGAVINGVRLVEVEGVIFRGGTVVAPGGRAGKGAEGYGVDMRRSHGVRFEGVRFDAAARGLVAADSRALVVRNARFAGLRSDGINLAGTSDVLIEASSFTDFTPVKPKGSKADGNFVDGDHPDAVQIWLTRANPVNRDIVIRHNVIDGDTQGINTFGPRLGHHERIRIENNAVRTNYPAAISVIGCSDCQVRFNTVAGIPGARFKANVRTDASTGQFCGNRIRHVPRHPANAKC